MTTTIVLTIVFFLTVILLLVGLLLFAKAKLSPSGKVTIVINGEQTLGGRRWKHVADDIGQQRCLLAFRVRWWWNVCPVPMPSK